MRRFLPAGVRFDSWHLGEFLDTSVAVEADVSGYDDVGGGDGNHLRRQVNHSTALSDRVLASGPFQNLFRRTLWPKAEIGISDLAKVNL